MQITFKGHELSKIHDMKKLMLMLSQKCLDELQKEDRKIQITTSHCLIIADKLHMNEPDMDNLTLLERSVLESEDTLFPLINEGNVTNQSGMILLINVKIIRLPHLTKFSKSTPMPFIQTILWALALLKKSSSILCGKNDSLRLREGALKCS